MLLSLTVPVAIHDALQEQCHSPLQLNSMIRCSLPAASLWRSPVACRACEAAARLGSRRTDASCSRGSGDAAALELLPSNKLSRMLLCSADTHVPCCWCCWCDCCCAVKDVCDDCSKCDTSSEGARGMPAGPVSTDRGWHSSRRVPAGASSVTTRPRPRPVGQCGGKRIHWSMELGRGLYRNSLGV